MSNTNHLISTISKKWKLEQIPNKKLEMENKLMEERLMQLKSDIQNQKQKAKTREEAGGSIWSKGQAGLVTTYAKNVTNPDSIHNKDSILNKPSNRAIKLKVLKDEAIAVKQENKTNSGNKEKKLKCGQCEKNLAFTRCLECGEDYCANCFTDFHMKGALQKHRTTSIPINGKMTTAPKPQPSYQDHMNYQNQNRMPEYDNYARNESFGIYDNEDEEFMSNLEINDSSYAAIQFNTSKNEPNPGSLLYGTYDEAAEAASFQQALNAWRNPQSSSTQTSRNEAKKTVVKKTVNFNSKPSKGNITSRDSNVGTDITESVRNTFRALEDQIKSNHSLSCGERMLLMKLRRDGKENQEEGEQRNNNYLIEEIPQANSFKKTTTPLDLATNLAPELIEIDKTDIPQDIGYKRPDSIISVNRPQTSTSRPGTARPNTARASASRASITYESYICRVPSATLKNITTRNLNLDETSNGQYQSGIGEFLLLDVAKDKKEKAPPSSARSDKSNEPFKLSHKFYEMGPRSWQPVNSIAKPEPEAPKQNTDVKKASKSIERPMNKPVPATKTPRPTSQNTVTARKSKTPVNKHLNLAQSLQITRHKTAIAPSTGRRQALTPRSSRVKSAAGSYAASNPLNAEIAKSFLEFDIDDGRSSKLCQNEEDNDYYGKLEVEYKENIHRTSNVFSQQEIRELNVSQKKITEQLKNLSETMFANNENTKLNLVLDDEEYDNYGDDVDMDIEELKSLR